MQWQTVLTTTCDIANLINAIVALILAFTNHRGGATPPGGDQAE